MAKTKLQKKESLAAIAKLIKEYKDTGSVALVKFDGLTVADAISLRRKLRAEGVLRISKFISKCKRRKSY